MQNAPPLVQVGQSLDGTMTYLVGHALPDLPPVHGRDLEAAWDAARSAALNLVWGSARQFRFQQSDGSYVDLVLRDRDARCWAGAVEMTTGLRTAYGLSLCLRLLALVDLLARARWADTLCRVERGGARLHPALLRVAATATLTDDARFDETRFRAGLHGLAALSHAGAYA